MTNDTRQARSSARVTRCLPEASTNELSRLYRDVLAGIFHPSDDESVHGAWANALLGPVPKPE